MAGRFSKTTTPGTGYTDAVAEDASSVSNEAPSEPVQGA
jgi:hypothetical protein